MQKKSKYWTEKIDLTDDQVQALAELSGLAEYAGEQDRPGVLMAQVVPGDERELQVTFVPHDEAQRIWEITQAGLGAQ